MKILITGCAGFIGWKVCELLLSKPGLIPGFDAPSKDSKTVQPQLSSRTKKGLAGWKQDLSTSPAAQQKKEELKVIGIDNLNDYYDIRLKEWRLAQLRKFPNFEFHKLDIENYDALHDLFASYSTSVIKPNDLSGCNDSSDSSNSNSPFSAIINLAARAGVRYSLENPFIYYTTNVMGNLNLLELCREFRIKKYILASTSSLYNGQQMPFKEDLPVNEPISPYAASKKSGEVTCYTYHKLFRIDVTIVRYFTVYGPAGRPDMSIFRFISWLDRSKTVTIYGDGNQSRDFTYVDDVARGTIAAIKPLGFDIINLGSDSPHKLINVLHIIEKRLNKKANIAYEPFHPADMLATWADISKAKDVLGWQPEMTIENGVESSVRWFLENRSLAAFIKL